MRVVLAFSGGLDTSFCVSWLVERLSAEVVTVTVDTGGSSAEALEAIARRATALGASRHVTVDAKSLVYDRHVSWLIRGNVLRGEVYPLCVAAERTRQAIEVARVAREVGADAVAHGSTGAGNDQIRFDVIWRVLLPDARILTPIRDERVRRDDATRWLVERGLPVPEGSGRYSVNRGLWGTTMGGGWTHDSWAAPPDDAWDAPEPDAIGEDVTIGWEEGLPVSLDGTPMSGVALVEALEARTARLGVGRGIHQGETVMGIKGRVAFEAGAPLVLIAAHRELEKATLTRWQAFWKDHLARFYGERLHEGQYLDPALRDIEALIESSQRHVEGETRVRLDTGRFLVTGVRSPRALASPDAVYGEGTSLWDGEEARAFAKIAAVTSVLSARREGPEWW